VTGIAVSANTDDGGESNVRTGDIANDGGAFANFAGISTSSANTGVGSVNQSATAIAANASVNFGAADGTP